MGSLLMKKDDPTLLKFIQQEYLRQEAAPSYRPHTPFDDPGAPILSDGSIDAALLQKKGIPVPARQYMVLGDNYAMSGDSRDFGFVPEENLRGAPDFIFFPLGSRFGAVLQAHYPFLNSPRTVVWILAFIGFGSYYIAHRKRTKLPQKIS
jgi:signal peptidase I